MNWFGVEWYSYVTDYCVCKLSNYFDACRSTFWLVLMAYSRWKGRQVQPATFTMGKELLGNQQVVFEVNES